MFLRGWLCLGNVSYRPLSCLLAVLNNLNRPRCLTPKTLEGVLVDIADEQQGFVTQSGAEVLGHWVAHDPEAYVYHARIFISYIACIRHSISIKTYR